jgi:putative two-component system response regulator
MESSSKVILVIDDSSVTLHFLSELLKGKGYRVLTARNGKQAICAIDNNIIDLVLLDLIMPQMNGYEVLKYIKSIPGLDTVPVLIVSACSDQENIEKVMNLGASGYFVKPLIIEDLLAKVDFHLVSAGITAIF